MPDDRFRLPGSSYDQLIRIIQAYGLMRGPVGPADVARPLGIDNTVVSRNNGFLLGTGLVDGGNKKALTDQGQALARALEHGIDDEVVRLWREVAISTAFLREVVDAVRIRGGMLPETLNAHIAYSAHQSASTATKTGAGTIVEILSRAGLLAEREGKLVAARLPDPPAETDRGPEGLSPEAPTSAPVEPVENLRFELPGPDAVAGLSVDIRVNVDCSVDDLPKLADGLAELYARLHRQGEPDSES